ncbi:hypothetical protein IIZ77_02300, partial [Candidatus Saccharibacteria bacterium]|nr:hypothetical protein [Candidatus Saccharibacteria bacterium]
SLEDALSGYTNALGVFDSNLSLSDLFNVNNKISIINSALDILDQVAEFEAMISRLPNPEDVNYNSRALIRPPKALITPSPNTDAPLSVRASSLNIAPFSTPTAPTSKALRFSTPSKPSTSSGGVLPPSPSSASSSLSSAVLAVATSKPPKIRTTSKSLNCLNSKLMI